MPTRLVLIRAPPLNGAFEPPATWGNAQAATDFHRGDNLAFTHFLHFATENRSKLAFQAFLGSGGDLVDHGRTSV